MLEQLQEKVNQYFDNIQLDNIIDKESTFIEKTYDNITFDKLPFDIKEVCKVLHCERVPKTDKLLKMVIQTQYDVRVCLTNVGEFYNPEYFIGNKFFFTINLEPVVMRKVLSEAMISAFETPEKKVIINKVEFPIGTRFV